jgi:sucrose-6-phosphatase
MTDTTSLLLCCDLDRTLIPNGPQPLSEQAMPCLRRLVSRPGIKLAFVTGRSRHLVERAIARWDLPIPDYVAGDVGSTIYDVGPAATWKPWETWDLAIGTDWRGRTHADLRNALAGIRDLALQGEDRQSRFKLSYTAPADTDTGSLLRAIELRLEALGVVAEVIWSVDETIPVGLVDILPRSATKQGAVEFIRSRLDVSPARTVFAGDSGNDLPVLAGPLKAILVANATAEVRAQARHLAEIAGKSADLYLAEGGYRGMNGNYAAGVVEGVVHFFPEAEDWIG